MPGVAISWKKSNIGKKSKNKNNKNTKFIEQKTTLAKLDHTNESEPNAFSKKQVFNTRAQKSKLTFSERKNIKNLTHKEIKIKREVIKSSINEDHLIFVPNPQDSIKKQEKKPIHPMDKKGEIFSILTLFLSPLTSVIGTGVFFLIEGFPGIVAGIAVGLALPLYLFYLAKSNFKKAEKDKNISNFRDHKKARKIYLTIAVFGIILFAVLPCVIILSLVL